MFDVPLAHAHALLAERRVGEALAAFEQARNSGVDPNACDAGRCECSMLLGCWEDAWAASDAIAARQQGKGVAHRFWDCAPLAGRRVMLRCLHGFGDALQFVRYAPLLRRQAASLCVEAHPEIVPLLKACDGVDQVITWSPPPVQAPFWDAQIEIMELPWIFRATPATVPAASPYLSARKLGHTPEAEALAVQIKSRRGQGRLQVGLAWRSSNWNPLRSVPLPELARALAGVGNCDRYSLQQDGSAELLALPAPRIENIEADFAELAVRISLLDIVITVDGVLAHLAGALGKPVFVLLPRAADWRWGLKATTPWYPQTRLFRQQTLKNWENPIAEACEALRYLTRVKWLSNTSS